PAVGVPALSGGVCRESPLYETFIDTAAQVIYDPKQLGRLSDIEHKYDCQISTDADAIKYAKKAIQELGDPYTEVLLPNEVRQLQEAMNGSIVGIGVIVGRPRPKDDKGSSGGDSESEPTGPLKVMQVIAGGPADKAGIKNGDSIIAVNGQDITQLKVDDVVK